MVGETPSRPRAMISTARRALILPPENATPEGNRATHILSLFFFISENNYCLIITNVLNPFFCLNSAT